MKAKSIRPFDPKKFLASIGEGRKILEFEKDQTVFAQGGPTDSVFYVQKGKIKLTRQSRKPGREATVGVLGEGSFFGEGALAGQSLRMGSASAMTDCTRLCESISDQWSRHSTGNTRCRTSSFRICWRAIFAMKKISWINSSIPAKKGWPGFCCCWLILAKKASPRR